MKTYVGIDLGLKGAIVYLHPDGKITRLKMPLLGGKLDKQAVMRLYSKMDDSHLICKEHIVSMHGFSKASTKSIAEQSTTFEMCELFYKIPSVSVRAVDWQKEMFTGLQVLKKSDSKKDTKAMAQVAYTKLFPNEPLFFEGSRVPNENLIDARLIAEYARRKNY
jgi:hypothetical protein